MLVIYAIYCVVLHFNSALEKWAQTLPVPFKTTAPNEQSGLVSYKNLEGDINPKPPNYGMEYNNYAFDQQTQQQNSSEWNPGSDWSPEKTNERKIFSEICSW